MCDACKKEVPTSAAVINGLFGEYCLTCIAKVQRHEAPGSAAAKRDVDRSKHEKDMLQPWHANGSVNKEFVRAYPESAQQMYTKEELREI